MFQPNCPCCSCVVFSDDFNRSDSSSIGTDWTEKIGNWEIVSNTLRCAATIASNSWAYVAPATISGYQQHSVEVNLRSSSSGDEIGVVFRQGGTNVGSDTEKSYVRLTVGTGLMQVYRSRYNGNPFSPAMLQEPISREFEVSAAADTWHNLRICHNFDDSLGIWLNGELVYGEDKTFSVLIPSSGSGVPSTATYGSNVFAPQGSAACGGPWIGSVSGTPQFDDFIIEKGERRSGTYWDTIVENESCICEHCVAYSPSATVVDETCSTLSSGNWHFSPTSTSDPTPIVSAVSGEWEMAAKSTPRWAARCFVVGEDADSVDFTLSAKVSFTATSTEYTRVTMSFLAAASSGSKYAYWYWYVQHPTSFLQERSWITTTPTSQTITSDTGVDGVSGDVWSIRVQSDGSGTFTVTFAVNGSAVETHSGVTLVFDAEMNGMFCIAIDDPTDGTEFVYLDDISITHN